MESSKFNYNDQPFLVKFGMAISTIGCIWHAEGFKAAIRYVYYNITILTFKFGYKHSKWFRRRMMKRFKVNGAEPFLVFSIIQLSIGNLFDFEKITSEEYIERYIKDNELSEEDANKLRNSISEIRNKMKDTQNELRNK